MTAKPKPTPQQLDDQLAEFVDQLLDDKAPRDIEAQIQDQELLELIDTVKRIKLAFDDKNPDQATAQRIKKRLVSEWHKAGYHSKEDSVWQRLASGQPTWKSNVGRQRTLALVLAACTILLLVIIYPYLSTTGSTLTGAANGQIKLIPILLALGIAIGITYWFIQSKK